MSLDIENAINYLENKNYHADFSDISLIGHSTGGGSGICIAHEMIVIL